MKPLIPTVLLLLLVASGYADSNLRLELLVSPRFQKHLDWLSSPGLLAIALENSGTHISHSGRLVTEQDSSLKLERESSTPFKSATLRFNRREDNRWYYETSVKWNNMLKLSLELQIDASHFRRTGTIHLTVLSGLTRLIPSSFVEYGQIKLGALLDSSVQSRLADYLDGVTTNPKKGLPTRERILGDYRKYNETQHSASPPKEPGEAEPLENQWILIIVTSLFLFILPATLLAWFLLKYNNRSPVRQLRPAPSNTQSRLAKLK